MTAFPIRQPLRPEALGWGRFVIPLLLGRAKGPAGDQPLCPARWPAALASAPTRGLRRKSWPPAAPNKAHRKSLPARPAFRGSAVRALAAGLGGVERQGSCSCAFVTEKHPFPLRFPQHRPQGVGDRSSAHGCCLDPHGGGTLRWWAHPALAGTGRVGPAKRKAQGGFGCGSSVRYGHVSAGTRRWPFLCPEAGSLGRRGVGAAGQSGPPPGGPGAGGPDTSGRHGGAPRPPAPLTGLQMSRVDTARTPRGSARREPGEEATRAPRGAGHATLWRRRKYEGSKGPGGPGRGQAEHRGPSGQGDSSEGPADSGHEPLHFMRTAECTPPRASPSVSYGHRVTVNPT